MIPNFTKNHGTHFLTFISLTILIAAFFQAWDAGPSGSVTVLVRTADGVREVVTLGLRSGVFESRADADPSAITTMSARLFTLDDGSVITLGTPGIVQKGDTSISVLVASPVAPLMRTPLTVWDQGTRVAWVSPSDGSIQVFARTSRGAYVPTLVLDSLFPNSLGFTDDGASLVAGVIAENETAFYHIALDTGTITHVATINGLASVVPTP